MLFIADWVLPVFRPAIRGGAVLVRRGRVAEVGPADVLLERYPKARRHEFEGCVLMPGLVNAHTHLSLTSLQGLIEPMPFPQWLRRLVPAAQALEHDDHAAAASSGAIECLRSGVTAVGDIAYGPESSAAAGDAGLGGVFFWEVLGVVPSEVPDVLAQAEFPGRRGAPGHRIRWGISAHSPYTAGPDLLRFLHMTALRAGYPFAIHAAESAAEMELMARGSGPLEGTAHRTAFGFHPPRSSSVSYLERLGVLDGAVAVHCAVLSSGDPRRLARLTRGVVLCPRSNAYLRNGPAPVRELEEAGVTLALGTDSSASNEDLDLFAEARALRGLHPSLTFRRLIEILTLGGARTLSIDDAFGTLERGRQADLVAVRTGAVRDPEAAVIESGGPDTVEAVCTAGVLRVVRGKPVFPDPQQRLRLESGRERARAAVEEAGSRPGLFRRARRSRPRRPGGDPQDSPR